MSSLHDLLTRTSATPEPAPYSYQLGEGHMVEVESNGGVILSDALNVLALDSDEAYKLLLVLLELYR